MVNSVVHIKVFVYAIKSFFISIVLRRVTKHPKTKYNAKGNLLVEYLGSVLVPYHPVAAALFLMVSWYDGRSPILPMLPLQYPPIALCENWETVCGMW